MRQGTADAHGRRGEHGVAMIFALLVLVLVGGTVALGYMASQTRRTDDRGNRARVMSEVVLLAASNDLAARLERWEVGRDTKHATGTGYARWAFPIRDDGVRVGPFPIQDATRRVTGQYWVLRPPASICGRPGPICGPGGYLNIQGGSPERGTLSFFVEGQSTDGRRIERVHLKFKRGSLAQYSVLSDQKLDIGSFGSVTLPRGTAIHSNNVDQEAVAVRLDNVNSSNARRITARSGGIVGCSPGVRCDVTGKVVPFSSINVAFNQVVSGFVRGGGRCAGSQTCVFRATQLGRGSGMPMFIASLSGSCMNVYSAISPLRQGVSHPIIDDRTRPSVGASLGRYCPPQGGGAVLFEGDVQVQGRLGSGASPLSVMSRRSANFPMVTVLGQSMRVSEPASIYVVEGGGSFGGRRSVSPNQLPAPLGLVAQGSVYVPTWTIPSLRLDIEQTAVVAGGGAFSVGPTFTANAAEELTPAEVGQYGKGGGLNACSAPSDAMPSGRRISFSGTMASRGRSFFTYSSGGCTRGFPERAFTFDQTLGWYPMPFFPAPDPWHLVDWQEYRGA